MKRKLLVVAALFLPVIIAVNAGAVTRQEATSAVLARYRITTVDLLGNVNEVGSVFIVQKTGLKADKESRLFKPNLIVGRQVIEAGGGSLPLGNNLDGNLKVDDRLLLYRVSAGDNHVELALFTVKSFLVAGSGRKGPAPLQATTRFQYPGGLAGVTADQVISDIEEWFRLENMSSGTTGPAEKVKALVREEKKKEAVPAPVKTIMIGQSEAEVTAILGDPVTQVLLGTKKVFVYQDIKIVFIEGKVADAE